MYPRLGHLCCASSESTLFQFEFKEQGGSARRHGHRYQDRGAQNSSRWLRDTTGRLHEPHAAPIRPRWMTSTFRRPISSTSNASSRRGTRQATRERRVGAGTNLKCFDRPGRSPLPSRVRHFDPSLSARNDRAGQSCTRIGGTMPSCVSRQVGPLGWVGQWEPRLAGHNLKTSRGHSEQLSRLRTRPT